MGHEGHGRGDGEEALRRGVPRIRPQEGSVRLLKGEKQTIDRHTHKERQEEGEERERARAPWEESKRQARLGVFRSSTSRTWHFLLFACYRSFFVPLPSLRQLQLLIRVNLETQ